MSSPVRHENPGSFRFEFDSVHKILLLRSEGRLTDELVREHYSMVRKYATETDANSGIIDYSSVTEFAVTTDCLRNMARLDPAMPNPAERPRFIVVPQIHAYGLARMFQIMTEQRNPMLRVVSTLDEVFAALDVQSPHFEPLA